MRSEESVVVSVAAAKTSKSKEESPDTETISQLQSKLKELEKARQDSEKKVSEYLDKLQRLQADMENLQKITKRQIESITGQASRDLVVRLLPILDALGRAGDFARGSESLSSEEIAVGLGMLYKQLVDVLGSVGLEEIFAVGQALDTEKHEVVSYVERDDEPENTVVEEIQKGYLLNGKVIRPAMVIVTKQKVVSKATEESSESPP